jgi:DUF4097 and DUF4098 domain-containing protein YvlB
MDRSDILDVVKHVNREIEADVGDSHTLTRVKDSRFKAGEVSLKASYKIVVNQHLMDTISVHTLKGLLQRSKGVFSVLWC